MLGRFFLQLNFDSLSSYFQLNFVQPSEILLFGAQIEKKFDLSLKGSLKFFGIALIRAILSIIPIVYSKFKKRVE